MNYEGWLGEALHTSYFLIHTSSLELVMSTRLSEIDRQLKQAEGELATARQGGSPQDVAVAEEKVARLRAQRQAELAQIDQERKVADRERQKEKRGHLTYGGLVPAVIFPVNQEGVQSAVGAAVEPVYFYFNPTDYTITQTTRYTGQGLDSHQNYNLEYDAEVEPRKLSISSIWFDTTETGEDVRKETDKLFGYVEVSQDGGDFSKADTLSQKPPYAAFEWGKFRFLAVVESVAVEFVHFKPDGTPLRAKATVSFMEFKHRKLYARQNPTSGADGNSRHGVWHVVAHERLDTIAAEVYGDATQWRHIAEHNGLADPLAIYPGQMLMIPSLWDV